MSKSIAATAAVLASAPVAAPKAVKVAQVALRGGPVVATIKLSGQVYRTAAAHNVEWWKQITEACAKGPADVSKLLLTKDNPKGVPSHFIGYTLKRGYLVANPE